MTLTLIDYTGTGHRVEVHRDGRLLGTIRWRDWSDRRGYQFLPASGAHRGAQRRSRVLLATPREVLVRALKVPDPIAVSAITRMRRGRP